VAVTVGEQHYPARKEIEEKKYGQRSERQKEFQEEAAKNTEGKKAGKKRQEKQEEC
jgi:hypothetical protein